MKEKARERLKDYVKQDIVYARYEEDPSQDFNDFEKFCIQHCKDIKALLEENKKLYELCDALEEEHNTTFQIWKKEIEKKTII